MTRWSRLILLLLLAGGCAQQEASRDPRADIAHGWNYYRLGEFSIAINHFQRAALATNTPTRFEALYGLATTWNLRRPGEDVSQARGLYEQIIREAPQSDWAAWSQLALARLTHLVAADKMPNYGAVQRAYQEVREKFPGHPAAVEAFLFQQSARLARRQEESARQAVTELEQFIREQPQPPFVGGAYGLLATGHEILGQPAAQLAALIQGLERREVDPLNPQPDLAGTYWRIATVAEFEAADWAVARRYYRQLIADYPRDVRVFPAKQALARMDAHEANWRGQP